jgi:hypothetical protein
VQSQDSYSFYLTVLMYVGPSFALYVVGAVIASLFLTRYPRPAWLALLGCGMLILSSGSGILAYYLLMPGGLIPVDPEIASMAINLIGTAMHIVGLGLIFTAVFLDRKLRVEPEA